MFVWMFNILLIMTGALIGVVLASALTVSKIEEERDKAYRRGFSNGEIYGETKEMGRSKKHHHHNE